MQSPAPPRQGNHIPATPTLLALAAACSAACAQTCQPYWASLPRLTYSTTSSPIYPTIFDDGVLATPYVLRGNPCLFYRWHNRQWELLPTQGLPPDRTDGYRPMFVFDDGDGPGLYTLVNLAAGGTIAVRWRDNAWTTMSPAFWQYDPGGDWLPLTSADMGEGTHIYGKLPGGRAVRWNGQSWEQIGQLTYQGSPGGYFTSMIGYDDGGGMALYAFGEFSSIDGVAAHDFAKWDGHSWSNPWPPGVADWHGAPIVQVFDLGDGPKVYSNYEPDIGGLNHVGLHSWDGTTWRFLGGPSTSAPDFYGIELFDDGSGPALYVCGHFSNFAGLPARNLVRYDLAGFHTVPGAEQWLGFSFGAGGMRDERGESLLLFGGFIQYQTYGQLVACPSCPADCNADGRLNVLDFVCFLNAYASLDPYANADSNSALNVADFMAFMNRFAAGCS